MDHLSLITTDIKIYKMRKVNNLRELFYVILNRFFTININNVKIPKKSSNLILAHLFLRKSKISFDVIGDDICLDFKDYKLLTNKFDESIMMSINESFNNDEYNLKNLNLHNKTILDIGANIGDTCFKFISKGVKKIYAIEPILETYKYLIKNIKLNQSENKIIPFNFGIGDSNEVIKIPIRKFASGGNSITFKNENENKISYESTTEVKVITSVDLKKHINDKIDLIKIDCEGCEYSLIKNNFLFEHFKPKIILIEYHRGYHSIINWLEKNSFKLKWIDEKNNNLGLICAIKIN